jgi:hypothetical protein
MAGEQLVIEQCSYFGWTMLNMWKENSKGVETRVSREKGREQKRKARTKRHHRRSVIQSMTNR